ncbi:uncharacterized protein LOC114575638 [Exaiptasia diaphana]|uniref:Uncharacterized protein n=1 Tax=Exaiptasia diaphana TaxID=2652724 RepID=A0A913YMP7_EXADI|nr:uncharacterized protein LOC114575638 [Exaiptasia diaphana]XP_028516751.1 uncharacterized protein LOC114575638 [Exaiptasia diaphana]
MGDQPATKRQEIIIDGIVTVDQTNQIVKPVENMIAKPWIEASSHVKHVLEVFRCYRKIFQIVGRVIQDCKDGVNNFDALYTKYSSAPYIDQQSCSELITLAIPSKDQVKDLLTRAANADVLNFNANNCQQNKQSDDPGYIPYDVVYDDDDDDEYGSNNNKLSASQRFLVCDLRIKRKKTQSQVAQMIKMDQRLVGAVRCQPQNQGSRKHKVALPKLMKHHSHML